MGLTCRLGQLWLCIGIISQKHSRLAFNCDKGINSICKKIVRFPVVITVLLMRVCGIKIIEITRIPFIGE